MRLILDPPCDGAWNMAVDQAILDGLEPSDTPVLRFYSWAEPTLSLGYFQPYSARTGHRSSRPCDVVRRPSGGGAILHHHELTYCLVIPFARLAQSPTHGRRGLYRLVHGAAADALSGLGVTLERAGASEESPAGPTRAPAPFLCFRHITPEDGLVAGRKVLGSAQRRTRIGLMQHGSMLWCRSDAAPELPGLVDLCPHIGRSAEPLQSTFREAWQAAILDRLRPTIGDAAPSQLQIAERERANGLVQQRYRNDAWTKRR